MIVDLVFLFAAGFGEMYLVDISKNFGGRSITVKKCIIDILKLQLRCIQLECCLVKFAINDFGMKTEGFYCQFFKCPFVVIFVKILVSYLITCFS